MVAADVPIQDRLQALGLLTLGDDPPLDAVEAALRRWASGLDGTDPLRIKAERAGVVDVLKAADVSGPAGLVDAALRTVRGGAHSHHHNDDNQKDRLLALAAQGMTLFHDERDRAYAWVKHDGHREVWPLSGRTFRSFLSQRYHEAHDEVLGSSVLADVLLTLEGRARFEGERYELANRIARGEDGAVWYDLADNDWRAIAVASAGWTMTAGSPRPMFRRYAHQRPQVVPVGDGDLPVLLAPFLNLASADARVLVMAWLVVALVPDIPRAILVPWGPQGSAKSTMSRLLRALIDPSAVPMPRFPRGDGEVAQVLDHHAAAFFDNVSTLSDSMSDTLCRAVTGDGFQKRRLYSDDDDVLYQFRRVMVLNGINVPAQRPDLLDRCVLVQLEKIDDADRREEAEFWQAFEAARPRIFGAMLDTLSRAMALEPDVRLGALPRMADWTRWGYAAAEALGLGGDRFLDAYRANRSAADEEALSSHPVGAAVVAFMAGRDEWEGEPSMLLRELETVADTEKIDTRSKLWPKAPNWLGRRLNEVEHNLSEAGIRFDQDGGQGRGQSRRRRYRLWRGSEGLSGTDSTVPVVPVVPQHAGREVSADGSGDGDEPTPGIPSPVSSPRESLRDNHGDDGDDGDDTLPTNPVHPAGDTPEPSRRTGLNFEALRKKYLDARCAEGGRS